MHRIYSALIDIVAAAIFIVPLLALYGKISLRSLKQTLIYIVFAFYLVAVLSLVGFPSVLSLNLDFTINIIPLVDMISDFVNACLNVLLFVPLGFLLPMLWKKYKAIPSRFIPARPTMPLERTTAPSTGLTMTPFTAMCCGKSGNVPGLP